MLSFITRFLIGLTFVNVFVVLRQESQEFGQLRDAKLFTGFARHRLSIGEKRTPKALKKLHGQEVQSKARFAISKEKVLRP